MKWGKRTIAGTEYSLEHLDPFPLPVNCGDKTYKMQVSFGAHSFTREYREGDKVDLQFMDGKTHRTFCVDRYAHSLHLPAAICQAINGKVCNSRDTLVFDATLPGLDGPYLIAFNLRRMNSKRFDARLYVRSAHYRPNLARDLPEANFSVVITSVLKRRPIRWTKK